MPSAGSRPPIEPELQVVVDRELAPASAPGTSCSRAPATTEPGTHGTFADVEERLPEIADMGVRRAVPAADPPDRPELPERAQQRHDRRARRPRQSVGDRLGRRRPHRDPSRARHPRGLPAPGRGAPASTASRSRWTSPSSARPTIRTSTEHPEWFRRRPDGTIQYAENPPKKYQDIYPFDFETEAWQELWAELQERRPVLDRPGHPDLSRRQPAHEAVRVLGMADRRRQARLPRDDLSRRGVHAPEGHVPAGQARLHPVVQLLPVAEHQAGADRIPDRADPDRGPRVLRREPVAEHARHPARVPAVRRAAGVRVPVPAGGDARPELRHLRPGVRAVRSTSRWRPARRNTSIRRNTRSGRGTSSRAGSLRGADRARQPDPSRECRASARTPTCGSTTSTTSS